MRSLDKNRMNTKSPNKHFIYSFCLIPCNKKLRLLKKLYKKCHSGLYRDTYTQIVSMLSLMANVTYIKFHVVSCSRK